MLKCGMGFVLVSSLLLTGCSSENGTQALNSGRTDIANLQKDFREEILSQYVDVEVKDLIIAEAASPSDVVNKESIESPELLSWRAEIIDSWKDLKDDRLDLVCEFFYQGIVDETSNFAFIFAEARKTFAREGTQIHSINNIRMREDNRKTIQFPTSEYSSSLFVCSSRIVLKIANGSLSQPLDSTLSWNYYLLGEDIKFTFTFKLKS
jgi:hypothetical protein